MFKLVSKFYEVVPGVLTQTGKVRACLASADDALKSAAFRNAAIATSDLHELLGDLSARDSQMTPRLAFSVDPSRLCRRDEAVLRQTSNMLSKHWSIIIIGKDAAAVG